jgi:hypothetical protein
MILAAYQRRSQTPRSGPAARDRKNDAVPQVEEDRSGSLSLVLVQVVNLS